MDAIQMIRDDHNQITALFQIFDLAPDHRTKEQIAKKLILALEVDETIEEKFVYSQIRRLKGASKLITLAEREHHDADAIMLMLSELPRSDPKFDESFAALKRTVEPHFRRDEAEILPKANLLNPARLKSMAEQLEKKRDELLYQVHPVQGQKARRRARTQQPESGEPIHFIA